MREDRARRWLRRIAVGTGVVRDRTVYRGGVMTMGSNLTSSGSFIVVNDPLLTRPRPRIRGRGGRRSDK